MKKSVLDIIYSNENLSLIDLNKKSESFKKLDDETFKIYEKLEKLLNNRQKKVFHKFLDNFTLLDGEIAEEYYKVGLKMGVKLFFKCFCDDIL